MRRMHYRRKKSFKRRGRTGRGKTRRSNKYFVSRGGIRI